jgi:HD-GYP domain-containing protein (c-di-GMP phosphodiesterase class II)
VNGILNEGNLSLKLVGSMLGEDVYAKNKSIPLLRKGTVLNERHIFVLQSHLNHNNLRLETCSIHQPSISVEELEQNYKESLGQLKSIFEDLEAAINGSASSQPLQQLEHMYTPMLNTIVAEDEHFELLKLLRKDDEFTYVHSLNVGVVSSIIGKLLAMDKEEILLLGETGILHDIGKLSIPLSVLKKNGQLDPEEWELIRNHTVEGVQILKNMGETRTKVIMGTLLHHERLDGSGYPYGVREDVIPFHAQIISVADTYDAITAVRPYKGEQSPIVAVMILMEETAKGKFSSAITVPFTKYLMDQFIGQQVLLNTGEQGTIITVYDDMPHCPLVYLGENVYIDLRFDHTRSLKDVVSY